MSTKPRKIIKIDEEKCNGCGDCITACSEGALQLVNGKAKLVKDDFCDGFGDCLGKCPTGALVIEERAAPEFDIEATKVHVRSLGGREAVAALEQAHQRHESGPKRTLLQEVKAPPTRPSGGCPGSAMRAMPLDKPAIPTSVTGDGPAHAIPSELTQWPIQIHLVQPTAPFFKNKELVVMATCGPVASADVHWRFMRGRSIVIGCPKLDRTDGYVEKLAAILSEPSIPRVLVVRMEVPCCGGLTSIVAEAVQMCGREDLCAEEVTLGLNGDLRGSVSLT